MQKPLAQYAAVFRSLLGLRITPVAKWENEKLSHFINKASVRALGNAQRDDQV